MHTKTAPAISPPHHTPTPVAPWGRPKKKRLTFFRLKIIDGYLLHQVVNATLQGFFWFAGLLLAVAVITSARKVVAEGLPFSLLFLLIGYEVPRIVFFTLPMSLLFATVQTFSDMSLHGELTAIQVAGASLPRLLLGPLLWAILLTLVSYGLQEWAVPLSQSHKDIGLLSAARNSVAEQHDLRYEDPPPGAGALRRVIQAASFNLATGALSRPRFQFYDANGRVNLEIVAQRGVWNPDENSWQLFNGESVIWPSNRQYGANIISYFAVMSAEAPGPKALKSQSLNLTLQQHLAHGDYEIVSLSKLWRYRRQLLNELHRRDEPVTLEQRQLVSSITFGIHDKIATPLLCLAVVLAGAPLGVRPQRASGFSMGISLCVLLLYYAVWTWASTMGASGVANPVAMAYLALLSVILAGTFLLWRKSRI